MATVVRLALPACDGHCDDTCDDSCGKGCHVQWAELDLLAKVFQNVDLHQSLLVEACLVANELESAQVARLVVSALQHLAKAALAKAADDLKAVGYVVPHHHAVVTPLIIIPANMPLLSLHQGMIGPLETGGADNPLVAFTPDIHPQAGSSKHRYLLFEWRLQPSICT